MHLNTIKRNLMQPNTIEHNLIIKINQKNPVKMPAMSEQQDIDHFSVRILVGQNYLALDQGVDHLSEAPTLY